MNKINIVNIVMNARIPLEGRMTKEQMDILAKIGWQCTNEIKSPILIKKYGSITVCLNMTGFMTMYSIKRLDQGTEIYNKVYGELKSILNLKTESSMEYLLLS